MKLKHLIEKLSEYNQEAIVGVIVHNQLEDFSITFGGCEGVAKSDCENVSFYVDRLCQNENE